MKFNMMKSGLAGRGTSRSSRTPPGLYTPPGWNVSPPGDTKAQRVAPAILWLLNTMVFGVAPITFVYGTVLQLLVETVPFLTSRCPGLVTLLVQVVLAMWLFLRSWDLYILHIKLYVWDRRYDRCTSMLFSSRYCSQCGGSVAATTTHCDLCDTCVIQWRFHSTILNACVSHMDFYSWVQQKLLHQWRFDSLVLLCVVMVEAILGGPLRLTHIMFFALACFSTSQYVEEQVKSKD